MSDQREKQPPVRTFARMVAANYEVELKAWPYSTIKSENVISPKLVYHIQADSFEAAVRFAAVLRDTVRAMHDIWVAEIVCVKELHA